MQVDKYKLVRKTEEVVIVLLLILVAWMVVEIIQSK